MGVEPPPSVDSEPVVEPVVPPPFEPEPEPAPPVEAVPEPAEEPEPPPPPFEPEPEPEVEHEPTTEVDPATVGPGVAELDEPVRETLPPFPGDDPLAKSQPIVVGIGDPFADESGDSEPTVLPPAAVVPAGDVDVITGDDNQLHLQLKGSGAIAEMGQVRALDIEVPVPGQWVGNRKVTLQLRLTLTPAEEDNG
jgi:hypothetical protein